MRNILGQVSGLDFHPFRSFVNVCVHLLLIIQPDIVNARLFETAITTTFPGTSTPNETNHFRCYPHVIAKWP
jgi:hypothetical protein